MTQTTLSLDDSCWLVREALGLAWQWHVGSLLPRIELSNNVADAATAAARTPGWLAATVPGSVVTDLWHAGDLSSPYTGTDSRAAEWVATRSWVYRRTVDLPALGPNERAVLELDGVDPWATVVWDGTVLGSTHGLYEPARFDVTDRTGDLAAPGRHELAVVVHPAPNNQPQVGRTDLVRNHSPRMSYGWDFCPRLPHQGIWRSVRVVIGTTHLVDVAARTEIDGSDAEATGRVHVTAWVENTAEVAIEIEAVLRDADGRVVATATAFAAPQGGAVALTVEVPAPKRWWPSGYGPQTLYGLEVGVAGGVTPTSRWTRTVGFRDIRMVANPGAPAGALPYTALVNGVRVELLGWNWVPADVQFGVVRADRLTHLLDLALRSGACLVRVWGGGLMETEEFYDACDRGGLLVWQEFSQSSSGMQSAPSASDAFVALMGAQADAVVPPRMHHPSLLMWGGGNELEQDGVPLDEDRSPVLARLRADVSRLDPGRHWVPTSPSGPAFHNRLDVIAAAPDDQHDVHGPWEHQGLTGHPALYDAGSSLAHSEFGVEGMTNLRALCAFVPAHQRTSVGRDNPVMRHLGEWWNNLPLVQDCFSGRLDTVERVQRASQLLQAAGLAYAVEADRRRFPRCSMVLPWQLNESYPNVWCTSAVDFRGDGKPALHSVRRAFAPNRATLQAETSAWAEHETIEGFAWVWSRGGVKAGSDVRIRLLGAGGEVHGERTQVLGSPVREPRAVGSLSVPSADLPADRVLIWEILWTGPDGQTLDRESVLASTGRDLSALLDLPVAGLDVGTRRVGPDEWCVRVRHQFGPAAVGLQLVDARDTAAPGWMVPDGDPRPLAVGEERTFQVLWRGDRGRDGRLAHGRRALLESWNTSTIAIPEPTAEDEDHL